MSKKQLREILTSNVISVSPETPISEAVSLMKDHKISCLVVVKDSKPIGIFTERDFVLALYRGLNSKDIKIDKVMGKPVLTAQSGTDIYEACNILVKNRIRHLVIIEPDDRIAGVVSLSDITNNLGLQYFVELRNVSKIMTKNVVTVSKEDFVKDAVERMAEFSISCLIVEEKGLPVGILTERDVVSLFRGGSDITLLLRVEKIMSHPVVTISPDTPVYEADGIMNKKDIRRLVIVDKLGRVSGLVTQSDIVKRLEERYVEFLKRILQEKESILEETKKKLSEKIVLENILRSATDMAIVATDLDFHIIYFNPAAEKLYGYSKEQAIHKTPEALHKGKELMALNFKNVEKIVKKRGEYDYAFQQQREDGVQFVESKVSGIWGEGDRLVGYVLMSRDVTERTKAELKVEKSHEMLTTVLDSLDAVVYVADMNTHEILFVNKYLRKTFGNVVGEKCWHALQNEQTGPCDFCTNEKLLDKDGKPKGVYVWEFQNTINGRWYVIHDRAIRWVDGRIVRLEIATDITKRKTDEEQLKKHAEELEEANRFKDLFTDILRHDLLNPAGIVSGVIEAMLVDSPDDKELQMIKRNSNKVIEIIESASKFLKLESLDELEKKRLDLREVIDSVILNNKPIFESAGVVVNFTVKEPLPVMANVMVEDVVLNLLTNASKYAAEGKRVNVEVEDKGKSYKVLVKDYGQGVPDKYKDDIFIRFKRREKGGVKGSGLGLAISKKIMEFHKGKIWVEDNPGGGSVFCFEIPKS
jgi:PAS domain S-box-containing protein